MNHIVVLRRCGPSSEFISSAITVKFQEANLNYARTISDILPTDKHEGWSSNSMHCVCWGLFLGQVIFSVFLDSGDNDK